MSTTTLTLSSEIRVENPPPALLDWCKSNLIVDNPDYQKKLRMGKWLGGTPPRLYLYRTDAGALILPFGVLREVMAILKVNTTQSSVGANMPQAAVRPRATTGRPYDQGMPPACTSALRIIPAFPPPRPVNYAATVPLYDYQAPAVEAMAAAKFGILSSPAGSGKTQMGIALISRLGLKTLWLTHTRDLLKQSMERAALYMDKSLFGTITAGKVDIGAGITFATVQTLAAQDLTQYRDVWDCVIVDECHRVAGSPTAMTQFGRVLSHLSARRKYGLSATVHRADGLIKCTHAYLGPIAYTVPAEAVAGKVMTVRIRRRLTEIPLHRSCLDTDGTLCYAKLIRYLTEHPDRNARIIADLVANREHHNLILSDRLDHLRALMEALPPELRARAVMIDGSQTSKRGLAEREAAIEAMRTGDKHYLFASYRLAKEGLDIPRLDRLYLTTPQTDYAVVTQSVGRIARTHPAKAEPICYDYVDAAEYLVRAWKMRCRHYRKAGGVIEEVET